MKINNSNLLKILNNNKNMKLPPNVKVGDIINAKVIKMVDNLITLQLNNSQTIEAKDLSNLEYGIGDKVDFIISENENGRIIIKPIQINDLIDINKEITLDALNNSDNRLIIDALLKNNLPITKDNISTIKLTEKFYGKLGEIFNENNLSLDNEIINQDIKKALQIIIKNFKALNTNTQGNEDVNIIENRTQGNEKVDNNENKSINIDTDNNKFGIMSKKKHNHLSNNYLNSLSSLSKDKIALMLSNKLDFNLKNIKLLEDIIIGKKNIAESFKEIISELNNQNIDKEYRSEFTKIMKEISNSFFDKLDKKENISNIKQELMNKLENFTELLKHRGVPQGVLESFEEIKTNLSFIDRLNQNNIFIQIPFILNDEISNLDLIIMKNKKKKNKNEYENKNILISLNTNNLNVVQSLIQLNNDNVSINFRLNNNKIKRVFKENETMLRNKLEKVINKKIVIQYKVYEKKESLMDIIESSSEPKLNKLDLRV